MLMRWIPARRILRVIRGREAGSFLIFLERQERQAINYLFYFGGTAEVVRVKTVTQGDFYNRGLDKINCDQDKA